MTHYNAETPAPSVLLASYDSINPVTQAANENIVTKPGCPIVRPNGANAGHHGDHCSTRRARSTPNSYCIDFVRASRAKGTAHRQRRPDVLRAEPGRGGLRGDRQRLRADHSADHGRSSRTSWSARSPTGARSAGRPGAIHLYKPPDSAATLTFFLQAIGTNLTNVAAGCAGLPTVSPGTAERRHVDGR